MMAAAPVLCLTASQIEQLMRYCAIYRSYLWQHTLPTLERNQTIRRIQALQGRLEKAQEQVQDELEEDQDPHAKRHSPGFDEYSGLEWLQKVKSVLLNVILINSVKKKESMQQFIGL